MFQKKIELIYNVYFNCFLKIEEVFLSLVIFDSLVGSTRASLKVSLLYFNS